MKSTSPQNILATPLHPTFLNCSTSQITLLRCTSIFSQRKLDCLYQGPHCLGSTAVPGSHFAMMGISLLMNCQISLFSKWPSYSTANVSVNRMFPRSRSQTLDILRYSCSVADDREVAGLNPTNTAWKLWQFPLRHFPSVFQKRHKSCWSLLSDVYGRGSKRSHTGGKMCNLVWTTYSTWSIMSTRRW